MDALIAWIAFLGAWCLFAGPVYQAALELRAREFERERLQRTVESFGRADWVSPWWWLLPPVAYLKQRERNRAARERVMHELSPADLEKLITYMNTATGWLLVGFGGLCIGLNETWELHEHYEWGIAAFVVLAVAMAIVSVLFVVLRLKRSAGVLEQASR